MKHRKIFTHSISPLIAISIVTFCLSQVAKAQAAEETFTYQAGGSQVTLVRDTEHIVVRYVRDATKPRVARQLPPGYKRLKGYEVANSDIEVLESPEPKKSGKLTPERAKAIAEELSQSGAVQYIEHPYFRQGSREVLTPTRQLLIRLGKGVTLGQVLPIEVVKGSEMLKGTIDTFIVNLSDTSTEDMLRQLKAITETPGVLWAEPNFQMTLKTSQLAPPVNDPHYPDQWHLNNTGQSLGTAGADVGAAEAWGLLGSGGTPDVKIAIIDHGVQLDHPDIVIATNLEEVNGQDGVDDDLNGYPDDKKGIRVRDPDLQGSPIVVTDGSPDDVLANHGTAVAGTAAATGNNGIGVAGLAHGASLLPIGLGSTIKTGPFAGRFHVDNAGIAEAFNYASGRTASNSWTGAPILNYSVGSGLPSSIVSDALEWAAHSGRGGKEAIICAASGNSGSQWIRVSVTLPETESNVAFAVAAYAGEVIYLDAVEVPGAAFQGFEGAAFPPAPVTTTVQTPGWMNDGWTRQTGTFPNVFSGNAAARFVGQSLANGNPRTGSLSYTFPNGVSGGTVTFRFRVTSTSAAGLSSFSGILLTDGFQKFWPPGGQLSEFAYFGRELGASGLDAAVQSHKDVIAVGASSNIDAPSFFTQSGSGLDFLAPGGSQHFGNTTTPARIFTSDRTGADGYVAGDIVQVSGTSFASPLTAGAAALLLSRDSNLPGILVRDLLRAGCEKVGVPEYVYSGDVPFGGSYNSEYGFGRLSIARSMQHLVSSQSFPASSSTGWAASTFGFASGHKTWRFPALGGYAVSAPGAFDWIASSDRLCFVRQAFYSGNCQIIARVGGVSGAANLAAGGVMVRTGFSGGGPFVFVGLRRDGGITFASRNQGAATFSNTLSGQASPLWVRITTTATAISASTSNNGTTWTSAGSISGSFSGYKEIGLTAVNRETFPDTTPVHATFDRVSVFGPLNIYTKAGSSLGYLDSSSTLAKFSQPSGVCTDNAGTIYVADTGNHRIRKIAAGAVSSIAGRGVAGSFTAPSNASVASLNSPKDVGLDTEGRLYVLDSGNHCIRRMVLATGVVSTFAGTPTQGGFLGDGGPASAAKFSNPTGFSLDIDGNIYVADTGNNRIRRIDARTEIVTTVAGGGSTLGDGALAVNAMLVAPRDVAVDVYGGMYVADAGQFRVRKIDLNSGVITTLAGTGVTGYSGNNGAATAAKLGTVNGIAVDDAGNVWFSDVFNAANHRVRRVSYPSGTISAVAGVGTAGFTGDNASGVAAQINTPFGITLDDAGELIFADSENNRIRRVK